MPPKRRRTEPFQQPTPAKRVTRSSTRLADADAAPPPPQPQPQPSVAPKNKRGRKTKTTPEVPKTTTEDISPASEVDHVANVIIVEHCTQCNQIKKRALEVKAGLEEAASGVKVLINPEKPRRGCFEIRTDGGDKFISIEGLKRPFKPLKDLNMTEVVAAIVLKLNIQKD